MSTPPPDSSTGLPPRLAAALSYAGWWVTGLLFWVIERHDPFVRFHAAQAMTAFGLIAAAIAGLGMLAVSSLSFLPGAFNVLLLMAQVLTIGGVVLWGVSLWRVAAGHEWRMPIAAEWAEKLVRKAGIDR